MPLILNLLYVCENSIQMTFKNKNRDTSFEGSYESTTDDKQKLSDQMEKRSDLKNYLHDPKTGEYLGRSFFGWCALIGFSACFSACIAAYWGINLWVFYQTLDNYTPRLQRSSSFIGTNPGLGYRPMKLETDPYSSLIW